MESSGPSFSDPQSLTVLGLAPFFQSQCFLGNLYHEDFKITDNTVDFVGAMRDCGFAYSADTTGHFYESEILLQKKEEISQLWKEFNETIQNGLLSKLKNAHKLSWAEFRGELASYLREMGDKMMKIGKTSTFCGVLTIWVANGKEKPQPATVIIQLGDSAIYRYRCGSSGYKSEVLTHLKGPAWEGYVGGSSSNLLITLSTLKSGDLFVITTDGLDDHFGKELTRGHGIEEKIEVLDDFSELVSQTVEEAVASGREEGKLEKVYQALLHHSREASRKKLKEQVIGEAELDDVGCTIVLAGFFEDDFMKSLQVPRQTPPVPQGFFSRFIGSGRGEDKDRERERASFWGGDEESGEAPVGEQRKSRGIFECFGLCRDFCL